MSEMLTDLLIVCLSKTRLKGASSLWLLESIIAEKKEMQLGTVETKR
jgi:hypothetical protein